MHKLVFLSCLTVGLSGGIVACSSNTVVATDSGTTPDTGTPQDSGKDTAPTDSGGGDTGVDTGIDAGPLPINGCINFVDFTAADAGTATITGPGANAVAAQYTPNCVMVKVGAMVTWNVGFVGHPLAASATGDTPNPVTATSTGTTKSFTFPTKGTYGFECAFHGGLMFGAVKVVP